MSHSIFVEYIQALGDPKIALVIGILALAGIVKGGIGFGMPLIGVSLLANVIDVRLAAALMIFPIIASNVWIGAEGGEFREILKRFWPVVLSMGIGIFAGSRILVGISPRAVLLLLGVVVVTFSLTEQLKTRVHLTIPKHLSQLFGIAAGLVGGVIGGLSTVFGPPLLIYLTALRMPKDRFVRTNSVISFFAALFIATAFTSTRLLTLRTAALSLLCLAPAFVGLRLGKLLRAQLNQFVFERITTIALFLLGLNLIRRAFIAG